MTTPTDTPLDACLHCGAERQKGMLIDTRYKNFKCGSDKDSRTALCYERESRQKLEAEVERLKENFKLTTIELAEIRDALNKKYRERTEKAEAEVERLRAILKDHATFMRKNGFDFHANTLDPK